MTSRKLPRPIIPALRAATTGPTVLSSTEIDLNSANINFGYPLVNLNTQSATSAAIAGIQIYRGNDLAPIQLVWNEALQLFTVGPLGAMRAVTTVDAGATGVLSYNGTKFIATAATPFLNVLDQNIATTASPTFVDVKMNALVNTNGNSMQLPPTAGAVGTVLTSDGAGHTNWKSVPSAQISNASGDTSVTVQQNTSSITLVAAGQTTQIVNAAGTQFSQPVAVQSGFSLTSTSFVAQAYVIVPSDMVILYRGTTNSVVTLPLIAPSQCRWLLIENLTHFSVSIVPSGGNTVDGSNDPLVLDNNGETTTIIADGNNNWITI